MKTIAISIIAVAACSHNNNGSSHDAPSSGGDAGSGSGSNVTAGLTPTFTFESGPVRPIALSPDGSKLFVANTPAGTLDIMSVGDAGLTYQASVAVGIDPVAVAARSNTEVWVVNQVSDSVSIVDLSTTPAHVKQTLLVGDEPSDIVFAANNRAFITSAHRGQQRTDPSIASVPGAGDPQLTTAGVPRADVWVFDATNLGTTAGGTPVAIVSLFGDTPRALAVTPDGNTVYVAIYKSGNGSMAISSQLPCPGFDSATKSSPCTVGTVSVPGAPPGPGTNYNNITAPAVAMILQSNGSGGFVDVLKRDWTATTRFTLPDDDVFAIDATSLATTTTYQHVGTTLFDMAVNPANGHVYVSNTQSRNDLRFEGPGTFAGSSLDGHLAEARITVLNGTTVTPLQLNKHIDYATVPSPAGTASHSLSMPLNIAVTNDGSTLYVSAFGSSKIGVFPTATLENNTFDPTTGSSAYISVSGGGPSGLVIDGARNKLYVATRFDDGVSVVDLTSGSESSHVALTNPEPAAVTAGRHFLYDATVSSSNGEASCASCHAFGDKDNLVWDLGNPDADPTTNPINIKLGIAAPKTINGTGKTSSLHPMKGPMTTQTLRGLINHGPMHWRGDRVSGFFGTDTNTAPPYNSTLAFENFIVAFNSLLGLGPQFSTADMQTFTQFALMIQMPPNPIRALDNSLNAAQTTGRLYFLGCLGTDAITGQPAQCDANGNIMNGGGGHFSDGAPTPNLGFPCVGCHVLNPAMGFFGTDGESSFEALPQTAKIPQLRNLYDKVGMFGNAPIPNEKMVDPGNLGPQIRGTGFEQDGSVDTIFDFLQANVFNANGAKVGFPDDATRRDVEQYLLAFDSDLAPIVAQQVTLRSDNAAAAGPRVDLMIARATTPFVSKLVGPGANECDLIAHVVVNNAPVTYRMQADKSFVPNDGSATLSDPQLRALAGTVGQEVTYTCVPPGWAS